MGQVGERIKLVSHLSFLPGARRATCPCLVCANASIAGKRANRGSPAGARLDRSVGFFATGTWRRGSCILACLVAVSLVCANLAGRYDLLPASLSGGPFQHPCKREP